MGNPFGVGQTVTSGIISAEGRPVNAKGFNHYFIQTDAAINPGNSGGALVDMDGKLIGINTAIFSKSGGSHGIGFAIPANIVKSFLSRQVTKQGRVVKPWFGAQFQPVTRDVANAVGLESPSGVLVKDLHDNSPANAAGLRAGDVIIRAAGRDVTSIEALRYAMNIGKIGSKLALGVWRGGKEITIAMPLTAPPDMPPRDLRTLTGNHPLASAAVANINPALASELEMPYTPDAVVVMQANSYVKRGDIIMAVNGTAITSVEALVRTLKLPVRGRFTLQLSRGGKRLNLVVR